MRNCFRIAAVLLMMPLAADFYESYFDFACTCDFSETTQGGDCGGMDKVSGREASATLDSSLGRLRRGGRPLIGSHRLLLPMITTIAPSFPIRTNLHGTFGLHNRVAVLRI
jgi:hypothetical protein